VGEVWGGGWRAVDEKAGRGEMRRVAGGEAEGGWGGGGGGEEENVRGRGRLPLVN